MVKDGAGPREVAQLPGREVGRTHLDRVRGRGRGRGRGGVRVRGRVRGRGRGRSRLRLEPRVGERVRERAG